ncbi:hypothetical protein [Treponema primitia]|uniref:hypothetical protein n=1 Tax=Treponema primitia TaxID=88058 RepID=UPI0003075349|nr:hypothetical protein [Treponema primitia]
MRGLLLCAATAVWPAFEGGHIQLGTGSALGGTVKYLLNPDSDEALNGIVRISSEYSLPEDMYFNKIFINNINFGH